MKKKTVLQQTGEDVPYFSDGSQKQLRLLGKKGFNQIRLFVCMLANDWGSQSLYDIVDETTFPQAHSVGDTTDISDNEKGKRLLDAISSQMRRELGSTFGWSANDIIFNRWLFDNRAARQMGVYQATRVLSEHYSTNIAKLGSNDKENAFLHKARMNSFAINPRSFLFPSAEGSYKEGLKLFENYKKDLDKGSAVYNCRSDDLYSSFNLLVGESMLGYALGLLNNAQDIPFYELDNRIYEVQGIALVVRDVINALYTLYPEIAARNNAENMQVAMDALNRICTYNPLYITSKFNSGELIVAYLLNAKNRLEDIRNSIRM